MQFVGMPGVNSRLRNEPEHLYENVALKMAFSRREIVPKAFVKHWLYRIGDLYLFRIAGVPSSTETQIEVLCDRIRKLCGRPHSRENEAELRKLARVLRAAINEHACMAKASLRTKQTAIARRDHFEE
jgi:BarA-like signal transduction histidine kinase